MQCIALPHTPLSIGFKSELFEGRTLAFQKLGRCCYATVGILYCDLLSPSLVGMSDARAGTISCLPSSRASAPGRSTAASWIFTRVQKNGFNHTIPGGFHRVHDCQRMLRAISLRSNFVCYCSGMGIDPWFYAIGDRDRHKILLLLI